MHSIYLIGIGGIGMSAIARYFYSIGKKVGGYDRSETAISKALVDEGIPVHYKEDLQAIPKDADVVIYTPAVPSDHAELVYYQEHGYNVIKRSDALQVITNDGFNICVAGTHGKTTTTTMIAHILRDSGMGCNAFLGGIAVNYQTNFWSSNNNIYVIEADEYDRSFLKLHPDTAVITAIDADHLDIYGTDENVKQAYIDFAAQIKPEGLLVKKFGLTRDLSAANTLSYSLQNETANVYGTNIKLQDGGYVFDVVLQDDYISGLQLYTGGMHNVENMIAAIAVARHLEVDQEKIKSAVASFKGVQRRFEYIVRRDDLVYIDDYAHHPEELKALLNGVKTLFPQKKSTIIFQPHLYSRTRDFATEFAKVLDMADRVILLPIYPARELPIAAVDSNLILQQITNDDKRILTKEDVLDWLQQQFLPHYNKEFGEVIITAGAGDIDQLVPKIKKIVEV